jgi:hypothetical protein
MREREMDEALNLAFFLFHTGWMVFNCTGWIWRSTRRWHLLTIALTTLSWFGLGIWYGWGYCPCTDWHWQVRARLGHVDPDSYVQLLVRVLTGLDLPPAVVDTAVLLVFAASAVLSVVLNLRDGYRSRGYA